MSPSLAGFGLGFKAQIHRIEFAPLLSSEGRFHKELGSSEDSSLPVCAERLSFSTLVSCLA